MVLPTTTESRRVVKEYGAIEGGKQTLGGCGAPWRDGKQAALRNQPDGDFVIKRVFDAPRETSVEGLDGAEAHSQVVGAAQVHESGL